MNFALVVPIFLDGRNFLVQTLKKSQITHQNLAVICSIFHFSRKKFKVLVLAVLSNWREPGAELYLTKDLPTDQSKMVHQWATGNAIKWKKIISNVTIPVDCGQRYLGFLLKAHSDETKNACGCGRLLPCKNLELFLFFASPLLSAAAACRFAVYFVAI